MNFNPEDGRNWLYRLEESRLSSPVAVLLTEMRIAQASGQKLCLHQLAAMLEKILVDTQAPLDPLEQAEAAVLSALIFYKAGDLPGTVQRLNLARKLYTNNSYYIAVVDWMMGCVLWQTPSTHDEAFKAWRRAMDCFRLLERQSLPAYQRRWYLDRFEQINQDLAENLQEECLLRPLPFQPARRIEQIRLFDVVEQIPAGGFGPVGSQPDPIGEVAISQVLINGRPYRLVHLSNRGSVLNLPTGNCVVVEVVGDSMNKPLKLVGEGINPGDYVLLRLQEIAHDGDIVAALKNEAEGSSATLKIFRVLQPGPRYELHPHSFNIDHKPLPFEGSSIQGIALIVFKQI